MFKVAAYYFHKLTCIRKYNKYRIIIINMLEPVN